MKIIFTVPDEVVIYGEVLTRAELRRALMEEDFTVLKPLISIIVSSSGAERDLYFNFLLSEIQKSVGYCVRKVYGYYDQETQEDIFWRGMAFIWENLGEFDETKSKFNTWIWLQVKYGSRNALRKEIRAKQLRVKCENNPALLVEELSIINKKGGSVPTSSLDSLLGREISETTKQESKVLKSVFEVLSEKDRMLINMKVSQMLSIEEIVSLLGPPANINQVSVAISRALKRAQNLYIEKMAEERAEG